MIDYAALASALRQEMAYRGDTVRGLAKEWESSPMSVTNAKQGKALSAEMLCRVCIYIGANPLTFWRYSEANTYGEGPSKDATYGTIVAVDGGGEEGE